LLLAAFLSAVVTSPVYAFHAAQEAARQIVPLADGGSLYVFRDGLMAKEDRYGRAQSVKIGATLESADGRKLVASSNEVARLHVLINEGHGN
jgi:hypothetical protein